jgi:hypothetical protein
LDNSHLPWLPETILHGKAKRFSPRKARSGRLPFLRGFIGIKLVPVDRSVFFVTRGSLNSF